MGRTLTLTKGSSADGVTVSQNLAGVFSTIFKVRTPKSRFYTHLNNQPFLLKLLTAAAAEISASSRLIPAYLSPTMRVPREYGAPMTYSAWRNTPLDGSSSAAPTQYNVETTARRLLRFESGKNLTMPQDWEFHLMLESTDLVDWTQANTFIEIYVDESAVATQVAA